MVSQNSINNTVQDNDFSVNEDTAANTVQHSVNHSDNTNTSSHANFLAQTGGGSGGDPHINFHITGASDMALGIDNSDSDALKLTTSTTPSAGTTLLECSTAGNFTYPLQSAFFAYPYAARS